MSVRTAKPAIDPHPPARRSTDSTARHYLRRLQSVRPVDVELGVRLRVRRYQAMMAPLLGLGGVLCVWLLHTLARPVPGTGMWALGTGALFVAFAVVAYADRRAEGSTTVRSGVGTSLVLLAAAALGVGGALLSAPEQFPLACVAALSLGALAVACIAARPLCFTAFVLLAVAPMAAVALWRTPPQVALVAPLAVALAGLIVAQFLLSAALTSALRSEVRHRTILNRLEVANEALFADREQLHTESRTDQLTGVANRRYLEEMLRSEWNRCRRSGAALSCVLLDIDHFKAFNDHYGHDGGDACLQQVGALLRSGIRRAGDVVARYGGEEFVVLLPETDSDGAVRVAELLQRAVHDVRIPHAASSVRGRVTLSFGVATLVPDAERVATELLKAADLALYEAKRAGRDRIVVANEETLESARMAARGLLG